MQYEIVVKGIKARDFPDLNLSVYGILKDNHNWDLFSFKEGDNIRPEVREEVEKLFDCKDKRTGFIEYYCKVCGEYRTIFLGCNGRLCTSCGKGHTDRWSKQLPRAMFDVPQRHIVLSLPDKIWPALKNQWDRMKVLMDAAIRVLEDVFCYRARKNIKPGAVVVLHPFGRDLGFKPHVHIIVTEGGFDGKGNFVHMEYISFEAMRKSWQYHVLTGLKKAMPKTKEWACWIDWLFKLYPKGFYAYLPEKSRIRSLRDIGKYLARYVRHPAIANFRLYGYDGERVTFWYLDNKGVKHYRTMEVFDFIGAIVQHIPPKNFKMIRHYGAYWRRIKARYRAFLARVSLRQTTVEEFKPYGKDICPVCGYKMFFVGYRKKGPPEKVRFGEKMSDWPIILARTS